MTEIWKDIKGYEGLYSVSNRGRIKNAKRILKPSNNGNGYMLIGLRKRGKRKNFYIHRLVALAFIENPENKPVINHKDYNRKNNDVNNLEWITVKENVNYSINNMRGKEHKGFSNTGEKYITYRATKGVYRIVIKNKEYTSCKSLEEAILKRDAILKGVV